MFRVDYEGADPVDVTSEFDASLINFNGETPASIYDINNTTFKYEVPVYYGDAPLLDADKNQVKITVYIGVKGDIDLSNNSDAIDASQALGYYAEISTGKTPDETQISGSDLVEDASSIYDHFAAFLGDVDTNEWAPDNWKVRKDGRVIDAVDATQILVFYSYASTEVEPLGDMTVQEAWNLASPFRFGQTE